MCTKIPPQPIVGLPMITYFLECLAMDLRGTLITQDRSCNMTLCIQLNPIKRANGSHQFNLLNVGYKYVEYQKHFLLIMGENTLILMF